MLINKRNDNVKFIGYDRKYPNLCRGMLTLEIDGEIVKFGNNYTWDAKSSEYKHNENYDSFWSSCGNCGFSNNYSDSYCNYGEWIIDANNIPEKYRKYASEIDALFNENVKYGCCGGCL